MENIRKNLNRYQTLHEGLIARKSLEDDIKLRILEENEFDGALEFTGIFAPLAKSLGLREMSIEDRARYNELVVQECDLYGIMLDGHKRLEAARKEAGDKLIEAVLPHLDNWDEDRAALAPYLAKDYQADMVAWGELIEAIIERFGA